MRSFLTGVFT